MQIPDYANPPLQENPSFDEVREQLSKRIQEVFTEIGMAAYRAGASGYSFDSYEDCPRVEVRSDDGTLLTAGVFVFNIPLASGSEE